MRRREPWKALEAVHAGSGVRKGPGVGKADVSEQQKGVHGWGHMAGVLRPRGSVTELRAGRWAGLVDHSGLA